MPIAKVQLPDGRIARFEVPDGTTPDQVQQFATQQFAPQPTQKQPEMLNIGQAGLGDAMKQVIADEGKLGSFLSQVGGSVMRTGRALGMGGDSKQDWAALEAANREANPVSSIAGDVAGTAGQMYLGGRLLQGAGGLAGAAGMARAANALRTGGQALMAPSTYPQALGAGAAAGALMTEGGFGDRLVGAAAGGAGGALGLGLGSLIGNAARAMSARASAAKAANQAQNAVRDATMQAGRQAGYVATPSTVGGGLMARTVEGLSGKLKMDQLASIRNQAVTDKLARAALNLSDDAQLSPQLLQSLRNEAFQAGYEPVRAAGMVPTDKTFGDALSTISKQFKGAERSFPGAKAPDIDAMLDTLRVKAFDAGDALDMTRLLREQADQAFRQGNNALGKAARKASDALESQIERHLSGIGDDGAAVLKGFRDARQLIAKTHTVEKALSEGSGNVSAPQLAAQLKKGKPLSGDLETIARYAQSFPSLTRVPQSGNANPLTALDLFGAGAGAGMANPAVAMLPLGRVGARYAMLSPAGQRAVVNPAYGTSRIPGLLGNTGDVIQRIGAPAGLFLSNQQK